MCQYNVHSKTCHQSDHTLWNRERFSVGRRVCPGHGDLLSFQILHTAEFMDDVQHIGHCLCRMVDIALQVDKRWFLLKNPVFVSFCHSIYDFVHVGISFSDVHIVTDSDDICHERNHVGCLTNCLTMRNLRFSFIQILHLKSEQVTCGSK